MVSVKVKFPKGALRASRKALIPEGSSELLSNGHEGARSGKRGDSFRLRGRRSKYVGSSDSTGIFQDSVSLRIPEH